MALVPNQYSHTVFDIPLDTPGFTETMRVMSVISGYYNNGGSGGTNVAETVLIENDKTILNQLGVAIRGDAEEFTYEIYKGPPMEYTRETKSSCYLPGFGRRYRTVEREEVVYWCFTPLSSGDNLGRTKFISAFVVYDAPVVERPLTPEESEKLEAAGLNVEGVTTLDRVVQSGEKWDQATTKARVIEGETRTQFAEWVENVETEHEIVEEEVDKWTIWNIKKNSLKPQDLKIEGPRHIKKTGFFYQFPFPLTPPKLKAKEFLSAKYEGVQLEASGGGATIKNRRLFQSFDIVPEKYNFYRATISEPDRDPSGDPYGNYILPPPAVPKPTIVGTSGTTDPDGVPEDPKPPSAGHTEPDDPDPPEEPKEVSYTMIGTAPNDNSRRTLDKGHAIFYDEDVEQGAVYDYYAEAVIRDSVSPESNHEQISYTGNSNRHRRSGIRRAEDGTIEVDADAPDDPELPPQDYGEVYEDDVPTSYEDDGDIEDLIDDIAPRQFAASEPDFNINMDILIPLLGLEYGQAVKMPQVFWETYGNQLVMSQQTLPEDWILVGFTHKFDKNKDGTWTDQKTNLKLRRRSKK